MIQSLHHQFYEPTMNYIELLTSFPPRQINSEEDLGKTLKRIDQLLDQSELNQIEKDYLNVLFILVYDYEERQEPVPDIYGVELLKSLIEERGLKQKDLVPIFKTESIASDILSGKRELTKRHIQELSDFFKISPSCFFKMPVATTARNWS